MIAPHCHQWKLTSLQAMSQLLISEVRYQQQSEQKEWLLFVDQLETELDRSQFEKVEGNRIYMKQDGKGHRHR